MFNCFTDFGLLEINKFKYNTNLPEITQLALETAFLYLYILTVLFILILFALLYTHATVIQLYSHCIKFLLSTYSDL